jgi:hypothetical protein
MGATQVQDKCMSCGGDVTQQLFGAEARFTNLHSELLIAPQPTAAAPPAGMEVEDVHMPFW